MSNELGAPIRHGRIGNKAERIFAQEIERHGKTWFFQPRTFRLPSPYRSYRPDFYVIEDRCFYEVVGTRQAYSFRREQMAMFRATYPRFRLEIWNGGAWATGPGLPRTPHVRPSKVLVPNAVRKIRQKLGSAQPGTCAANILPLMDQHGIASLAALARQSGLSYYRLYRLASGSYRRITNEQQAFVELQDAMLPNGTTTTDRRAAS